MTAEVVPIDRHPLPARVPPHDLDAEAALIGALLLSPSTAAAHTPIPPEAFYRPAHSAIYSAIVDLAREGVAADPITVADHLDRTQQLGLIGGRAELVRLQQAALGTHNAAKTAAIIVRHHQARTLLTVAHDLLEAAHTLPPEEAAALTAARLDTIHGTTDERRPATIAELVNGHLDLIERRYEHGPAGHPTGWADLDAITGGIEAGQLTVIAARPSMGKTAVAGQLATNLAAAQIPVLFSSVEMSTVDLLDRHFAADSRVDLTSLRTGRLSHRDWDLVAKAAARLGDIGQYVTVDDNAAATPASIRAAVRRHGITGAGVVIVDYLQLLTPDSRGENRQTEVAEISRALKRIAKQCGVAVVALAQLNRALELRRDKRPILADLRESGAIEQDADVVIGLYRDEVYNPESDQRGVLEMVVLKQRNGPLGTVRLAYDTSTGRIVGLAKGT